MRRSSSCLAMFVCVAASAGCMQSPVSAPTGYIAIPLTAPGAGGVTYRLPPAAELALMHGSEVVANVPLDGNARSLTVEVDAGDYGILVFDPSRDPSNTVWPLIR